MSTEQAAKRGGERNDGGGKGKATLLIVFLLALLGGGYLTYRDLMTPFAPVRVTVVGPDADGSGRPERDGKPARPGELGAASVPARDDAGAPGEAVADDPAAAPPQTLAEEAADQPAQAPAAQVVESVAVAPAGQASGSMADPDAADTAPAQPPVSDDASVAPGEESSDATAAIDATGSDAADATASDATTASDDATATAAAPATGTAPAGDTSAAPQADAQQMAAAVPAPDADAGAGVSVGETRQPSLTLKAVPTPQPEPGTTPVAEPSFDIIRIDSSGSGLVAGRAEPGTRVQILSGDTVIGTAEASEGGEFVAFVQTPDADEGQVLSLAVGEGAAAAAGTENVLILPSPEAGAEPTIVKATEDEVRIVQASPLGRVDGVTLDTISYDEAGAVTLAGRAARAQAIRVYVDGAPQAVTRSSEAGTWDARLDAVDAGRYVLRVDALAEDGSVESRAESPFQRVYPAAGQTASGPAQITVQPGNTLWVMARDRYGSGMLYTQIFAANRDAIRNPDLIYPGQIFTLPTESELER